MDPKEYNLDEDALDTIETVGAANTPPSKTRGPRPTMLDDAVKARAAGEAIPALDLGSAQNPAATTKSRTLWSHYAVQADDELASFAIGGCNTYAKALRRYQELLKASAAAGVYPAEDVATAQFDAWKAEAQAKADAKAAEKAAKVKPLTEAQQQFNALVTAAIADKANVSSDDLTKAAAEIDAAVSAGRKDGSTTEQQAKRRVEACILRAVVRSRLTPEDIAANKAALKAEGSKPRETKAQRTARILQAAKDKKAAEAAAPAPEPKAAKPKADPAPHVGTDDQFNQSAGDIAVFASKTAAIKDARKTLGDDTVENVDYKITGKGKRWSWFKLTTTGQKAA